MSLNPRDRGLRPGLGLCACALAALLTAGASPAAAQLARRVVVVVSPSPEPLERELAVRLTAELGASGFEVVSLERAQDSEPAQAASTLGGEHRPVAVFAIATESAVDAAGEESDTLQLWISDRHAAALERLAREHAFEGSRAASSLAVQGVEWLQARLADWRWPSEPPPAAPVPLLPPGLPSLLLPALDVGVLLDSASGGAALTPLLRLGYVAGSGPSPSLRWGGRLSMAGLGAATVFETELRRVEVRQSLALLEGLMEVPATSWLQPFASAGFGAYRVNVEGSAQLIPVAGRSETTLSALGSAGAGLFLHPGGGWLGKLEAQALFALQPTAVEIATTRIATFGRPLLLFSVGLGLAL